MVQRSIDVHGAFFRPYLESGLRVLDCGCGPGTITQGIASHVAPGTVVGVDFGESQIELAKRVAIESGKVNLSFEVASVYELPFESESFDRVFSHALMEHLANPVEAMEQWIRVLKPGGIVGVCAPDLGAFVLTPPSAELDEAFEDYSGLMEANGGDPGVGRKLGQLLEQAGFELLAMSARYECIPVDFLGEYLAPQLEDAGKPKAAAAFRRWGSHRGAMFAVAWVSAVGVR